MTDQPWEPDQVRRYYEFLGHPDGTYTEVRALDPTYQRKAEPIWCESMDQVLRACELFNGERQLYAGINPRRTRAVIGRGGNERDVHSIMTLPIDVDAFHPKGHPATLEEIYQAGAVADGAVSFFESVWPDSHPIKALSGNGWQVLVPVEPIVIGIDDTLENVEKALEALWALIRWNVYGEPMSERQMCLEYRDRQLNPIFSTLLENGRIDSTFDPPRIFRLLGTLNIKGEEVWDVDEDTRPHRVSSFDGRPKRVESRQLKETIINLLPSVYEAIQPERETVADPFTRKGSGSGKRWYHGYDGMRPCFRRALEDGVAMTGEEGHKFRDALVREAYAEGMSPHEIVSLFRGQPDFDKATTKYQVNHITGKGYSPYTCRSLQMKCRGIVGQYCLNCPLSRGGGGGHDRNMV